MMIFQRKLISSLQAHGEKIALEYGQRTISYSELLLISNKITKFLLDEEVGDETYVGIFLKNKPDIICATIGIANARCVFVPLDSNLPDRRLEKILKDLNLKYIITSKQSPQLGNISSLKKYFIEDILENEVLFLSSIQYPDYDENDSLYVYFTSGSTGTPKGIIGKNCSLTQFLNWEIKQFYIDSSFKTSQFISPFFDAFLRDVFVPLFSGGTVCIPLQEKDLLVSANMISWIDENKITLIHCVPSIFRVINDEKILTSAHFKSLKYVLLSGERIIPSELKQWYIIFGDRIKLFNLYGATESTMIRSYYEIQPEDSEKSKIPVGSPIDDTELLIANKDLSPCYTLVTGDLYIISDFLTKGYLNNQELSKEKFIKIVDANGNSKNAFMTGDKARVLPEGWIDLLGREDRQVKVRGIRIELEEIENALVQLDYIKHAVVMYAEKGKQDLLFSNGQNELSDPAVYGNESIIAFIIKQGEGQQGMDFEDMIQRSLSTYLPDYMIPARVVDVAQFPLLQNGKIDYKALLNSFVTSNTKIIPPANDIEEKLLAIWKEILGDKLISTEDSFHKIGGNSLSIMRLIAKIYTEYQVRISLRQLFDTLTIKKQAELIKQGVSEPSNMERFTF